MQIPRQSALSSWALTVFPPAGSQLVNANVVSASLADRQVIVSSYPQTVSANSQGASAVPPRQADSTDSQAVSIESLGANSVPQASSSSQVGRTASQAGSSYS